MARQLCIAHGRFCELGACPQVRQPELVHAFKKLREQNETASRNGAAKAVDRIQVLGKQVHVVSRSYLHNPRTTIG
jgi:hypothetical protein